jgi:integrase
MPEILTNSLKKAKLEAKQLNGFNENYFVAGDAFPISSNALAERKNTNCEKAGVKQIRLHDFRHSCASLLINNGANIMIVAKYLGHAKIDETLNTYSHLFKNKMDDIVNLMNKLDI